MSDVQRRHVSLPPEVPPSAGGPARSHYDFHAEQGDRVTASEDPDGSWRWQLSTGEGRLKLEAGNFPSRKAALDAARKQHGDDPTYEEVA